MADITCKNCGTIINIRNAQKGIIVCPNCDVENDCSEQIYDYASKLMASAGNEVSYKAAAEAFSRIEGYRDADMYRDNCLEQADICFKDATFLRAKTEMMKGDRAGLSFACHLFESISGWKDADEQLELCKMRMEALSGKDRDNPDGIYNDSNKGYIKKDKRIANASTRVKNKSDISELSDSKPVKKTKEKKGKIQNISKQKNPKKLSTIIIASCVGLALVGALIAVYFLVITPMLRYDEAIEQINNGNYTEGYAILTELGRDSEILENKKERAQTLLESGDFENAYSLFEETEQEDKIVDDILKRVSIFVKDKNYKDAIELLGKYKYDSLAEKRYTDAVKLINDSEYEEAFVLLTSNTFPGSDEKRASIQNISAELRFLGSKTGDVIELGKMPVENETEDSAEVLRWKIIDETQNEFLVLCESAVNCIPFDMQSSNVNWAQSYIRKILNLSLYNSIFTAEEKKLVIEKNVSASVNPSYETDPGQDCVNALFLLGYEEVDSLLSQSDRRVSAKKYESSPYGLNWWLRTPGSEDGKTAYVEPTGNINLEGAQVNVPFLVRPAMWIKKS